MSPSNKNDNIYKNVKNITDNFENIQTLLKHPTQIEEVIKEEEQNQFNYKQLTLNENE